MQRPWFWHQHGLPRQQPVTRQQLSLVFSISFLLSAWSAVKRGRLGKQTSHVMLHCPTSVQGCFFFSSKRITCLLVCFLYHFKPDWQKGNSSNIFTSLCVVWFKKTFVSNLSCILINKPCGQIVYRLVWLQGSKPHRQASMLCQETSNHSAT